MRQQSSVGRRSVILGALVNPGFYGIDLLSRQRTHLSSSNRYIVVRRHLDFGISLVVD